MYITIHLPVSKPIKKFLTHKFGREYQPNQHEWFGILVSSLLDKKSQSNWESRFKNTTYEEEYQIKIKLSYTHKHGLFLTPAHEHLLRKAIEHIFRQSLYEQAIINKNYYEIDYKTTFENILSFYGIEEEEKSYYQTLIRDFNRKKEELTKKKNS